MHVAAGGKVEGENMKRFWLVENLAIAIFLLGTTLAAANETNRTMLHVRGARDGFEHKSLFHSKFKPVADDKVGGVIIATAQYGSTLGGSDLGKMLGIHGGNKINFVRDNTRARAERTSSYAGQETEILYADFIHNALRHGTPNWAGDHAGTLAGLGADPGRWGGYVLNGGNPDITVLPDGRSFTGGVLGAVVDNSNLDHANMARFPQNGSFELKPRQRRYGLQLDYVQNLDSMLENLFFSAGTAIMHVRNDLKLNVSGGGAGTANEMSLEEFFNGTGKIDAAGRTHDKQNALRYGLMEKNKVRSKSGLNDLDLRLGYNIFNSENTKFGLFGVVTLPTGNSPEAKYLFEPIVGSRQWALGCGAHGLFTLWDDDSNSINFLFDLSYRYFFKGREKRLPGVTKWGDGQYRNHWAQYFCAVDGTLAASPNHTLEPLANFITQEINITPRSRVNAFAEFNGSFGNFTASLGYGLFYRQAEKCSFVNKWNDERYSVVHSYYRVDDTLSNNEAYLGLRVDGNANNARLVNDSVLIESSRLILAHPSQISHTIVGGVGYAIPDAIEYPISVGLGGSYEFSGKARTTPSSWSIFAKLCVEF